MANYLTNSNPLNLSNQDKLKVAATPVYQSILPTTANKNNTISNAVSNVGTALGDVVTHVQNLGNNSNGGSGVRRNDTTHVSTGTGYTGGLDGVIANNFIHNSTPAAYTINTGNPITNNSNLSGKVEEKETPTTPTTPGSYDGTVEGGGDLSSLLKSYLAQQQATLQAQQAQQAQLVRDAYNNNMSNLQSAYDNQVGLLGNTYNNTLGQLENNYNYNADTLNKTADEALRQAYVNRMLSQKNLAQQLGSAGLTGGAAESTLAGLINNYGNARNSIENERISDLASLLNTYQNNVNGANETYNNAMADAANSNMYYRNQIENNLANGVVGTYDNLYNALASGNNVYANAMTNYLTNLANNAADMNLAKYKANLSAANSSNSNSSNRNASNAITAALMSKYGW